jgi:hypothetical protein
MEFQLNQNDIPDLQVFLTEEKLDETITRWRNTAFNVALNKLIHSNGNPETVMQTGEAFGRGLFSQLSFEKLHSWTIPHWTEHIAHKILTRLGQDVNIQSCNEVEATLSIQKCELCDQTEEPHIATLFIYGAIRGILKSALPNGEVILKSTMAHGAPVTELIIKTNTIPKDQHSREEAKNLFITTQKL